ncbi:hypothetical protein ACFSOZ_02260 [Mesorhizobium newzealandense]|uniref:ApeA N-terminal domain-containing protein n=1 Tax=Mesorhizobium newzealandense TaxID=1300302 RepID=A0ABW4U2C3_9HYPH
MITKIGEKDRFGYDDRGRPVAVQIIPGFVAFGHIICQRIKTATDAGFEDGCRLYADGAATIYLFSPAAQAVELWSGRWKKDEVTGHYAVNPQYIGVLDRSFVDIAEARAFFETPQPMAIRAEYLTIDGQTTPHADIIADREFALTLDKAPRRFPDRRIDRTQLPNDEREAADDLDFLVHNLFGYVFRFHAASKLMTYANTLHFSRPAYVPQNEATFFISMEWRQMAARDAAFSLYHFQHTFEVISKEAIRRAPNLRSRIDLSKLRIARKLFASQFKDVVPMRNALGHAGEFYSTTKARATHSPNKNMFLEFVISGEVYSVESYGRRLSLDMSLVAAQRLERVKTLIIEALAAALAPSKVQPTAAQQPQGN